MGSGQEFRIGKAILDSGSTPGMTGKERAAHQGPLCLYYYFYYFYFDLPFVNPCPLPHLDHDDDHFIIEDLIKDPVLSLPNTIFFLT